MSDGREVVFKKLIGMLTKLCGDLSWLPPIEHALMLIPRHNEKFQDLVDVKIILQDYSMSDIALALADRGIRTSRFTGTHERLTEAELYAQFPKCYLYSSVRFLKIIIHVLQDSGAILDYIKIDKQILPQCAEEYEILMTGNNDDLNDVQLLIFMQCGIKVILPQWLQQELQIAISCKNTGQPYLGGSEYSEIIKKLVGDMDDSMVSWIESCKDRCVARAPICGKELEFKPSKELSAEDLQKYADIIMGKYLRKGARKRNRVETKKLHTAREGFIAMFKSFQQDLRILGNPDIVYEQLIITKTQILIKHTTLLEMFYKLDEQISGKIDTLQKQGKIPRIYTTKEYWQDVFGSEIDFSIIDLSYVGVINVAIDAAYIRVQHNAAHKRIMREAAKQQRWLEIRRKALDAASKQQTRIEQARLRVAQAIAREQNTRETGWTEVRGRRRLAASFKQRAL